MNKEDVLSIIVYVSIVAVALIVGFSVLQPAIVNGYLFRDTGDNVLFTIVSILVGIVINAVFVEGGHVIGAKLGGYKIIKFNIFGFCYYKKKQEDGTFKSKFKFPKSFDGLTGETVVIPTKNPANPVYFVLTPLVLFLIEAVVMYVLIVLIPDRINGTANDLNWLKYGSIVITTIALMFFLYNYFPAHLDCLNDGYRLSLFTKRINVQAYNEYLTVLGLEQIEEKDKEFRVFDELTDFTADVNMLTVYQKTLHEEYEKAIEILDKIIESPKLSRYTVLDAKLHKAYIYLMTKSPEEAGEFYKASFSSEERKYVKKVFSMLSLRTYLLYEGLVECSQSEVEYCKSKVKKIKDSEQVGLANVEEKLFQRALAKIEEKRVEPQE